MNLPIESCRNTVPGVDGLQLQHQTIFSSIPYSQQQVMVVVDTLHNAPFRRNWVLKQSMSGNTSICSLLNLVMQSRHYRRLARTHNFVVEGCFNKQNYSKIWTRASKPIAIRELICLDKYRETNTLYIDMYMSFDLKWSENQIRMVFSDEQLQEITCPITYSLINLPVKTTCGHVFEAAAISRVLHSKTVLNRSCPLCRTTLLRKDLQIDWKLLIKIENRMKRKKTKQKQRASLPA